MYLEDERRFHPAVEANSTVRTITDTSSHCVSGMSRMHLNCSVGQENQASSQLLLVTGMGTVFGLELDCRSVWPVDTQLPPYVDGRCCGNEASPHVTCAHVCIVFRTGSSKSFSLTRLSIVRLVLRRLQVYHHPAAGTRCAN